MAFAKVGSIEAVELGEDERGAPTASIIFDEELGAIRAVEELNDEDNWRFGMRVRLESGMAPSAARKAAGLPPRPKEKKPQFNERCATEGSSRAAAPPPPPTPVVPVPVIVEEIPEGRQRGKLVYLKEGLFFRVLRPRRHWHRARRFYRAGTPSPAPSRRRGGGADTRGVCVIRSRGHRALHAIDAPSSLLDAHRVPDAQASSASSGRATPSPRTTTRFLI